MYKKDVEAELANIPDDEPVFLLRARDMTAAQTIRDWVRQASYLGTPFTKLDKALMCAFSMEKWAKRNVAKVPD